MSNWYVTPSNNDLLHYGVLGMKWGVRRYQNEDGTLTTAGKKKYYDDYKTSIKKNNSMSYLEKTINSEEMIDIGKSMNRVGSIGKKLEKLGPIEFTKDGRVKDIKSKTSEEEQLRKEFNKEWNSFIDKNEKMIDNLIGKETKVTDLNTYNQLHRDLGNYVSYLAETTPYFAEKIYK